MSGPAFRSPEPTRGRVRNMEALDAAIKGTIRRMQRPICIEACCTLNGGMRKLAVADIDEALRLDPENAVAYYVRGTLYAYLKRHDRVIHDLTESLRIEPGNAQALFHRGIAYGELDELALAIEDLTEAIRLEPGNADAHRARGDCHRYKEESIDLAIADFNTALGIDPEHPWSYRGRGACYRMMQDFDRAIADYNEAVRLETGGFLCPPVPGRCPPRNGVV